MQDINKQGEKLKIGSGTTSIRNDVSKSNMIFYEESSRAIYWMGIMELIELRQTSATLQCRSCLKHVPEGLHMCRCGVWLRPNQSTLDRIRKALAALKTPYCRASVVIPRRKKSGHNPLQQDPSQSHAETQQTKPDGRTTKFSESLEWHTDGLTSGSSTSTTSPRLTSVIMHLTDSDYDMKKRSIPIHMQDLCVNDLTVDHQQMFSSPFNELKAKEYLTFQ